MKKFSDPRWNDTTIPEIVGIRKVTEEEKRGKKNLMSNSKNG
ncbi:hypothetical protein V4S28_09325 [Enterococcus cecorum]